MKNQLDYMEWLNQEIVKIGKVLDQEEVLRKEILEYQCNI